MKKWVEKRGFPGLSDEMCTVLLALPYGNEDFKSNVAETSVWGSEKPLKS